MFEYKNWVNAHFVWDIFRDSVSSILFIHLSKTNMWMCFVFLLLYTYSRYLNNQIHTVKYNIQKLRQQVIFWMVWSDNGDRKWEMSLKYLLYKVITRRKALPKMSKYNNYFFFTLTEAGYIFIVKSPSHNLRNSIQSSQMWWEAKIWVRN